MVCKCRVPAEDYPENAEWGPLFWKLLHGLAELSGKQTNTNMKTDEVRLWSLILSHLKNTLPCDICRAHYSDWLIDHPPEMISKLDYSELGSWIKTYLWTLHNIINEGNDREEFDWESLTETYKNVNLTDTWKALQPVMKKAVSLNGVTLLSWTRWLANIRILQGMY